MFGKLYAEFGLKWIFLAALSIFEVGSILCAAAPNSPVLVVGRAIAGLGAAGVAIGALTVSLFPSDSRSILHAFGLTRSTRY
jgi:MFS family permease